MEQRREDAKIRNAAWAKLSPKEQLKSLDRRGLTAKRQREKILNKIMLAEQKKSAKTEAKKVKAEKKKDRHLKNDEKNKG